MHLCLFISSLTGGGAERFGVDLADCFLKRGHQVTILLVEGERDYEVPKGCEVELLELSEKARSAGSSSGKGGKIHYPRAGEELTRRLEKLEADLVISTTWVADRIATHARHPELWLRVSNNLSGKFLRSRRGLSAFQARRKTRQVYEGKKLIGISEGVLKDLRDNFKVRPAREVVIYNGLNLIEVEERAGKACEWVDLPEDFILHVGSFKFQKRHDLLLEAYAESKIELPLILLGKGTLEGEIREKILSLGLEGKVKMAGFFKNPYPFFAKARLTVLSSEYEGLANVLLQSLACGTPTVSTRCPSGPEEVMRGALTRGLVEPGDVGALARGMREMLVDPPSAEECRSLVLSMEEVVEQYLSLLS